MKRENENEKVYLKQKSQARQKHVYIEKSRSSREFLERVGGLGK